MGQRHGHLAGAALLAGLVTTLVGGPLMAASLAGSEWGVVRLGDLVADPAVEQFVRFEAEGRVVGQAGCNRFTGRYTLSGDTLTIGPLAATRMACPPPRMALEQALFSALERTRRAERDRTRLSLFDAAGTAIAEFRQRDGD